MTGVQTCALPIFDAPNTPLMHLIMWDMGIEPTLMALYDYPEQMREILDLIHERNKEYYHIACRAPGPVVRPMEDTSTMLTSPAMYRQWALDHLKDYAAICHQHGKLFIVHMCGHLADMVDLIAEVSVVRIAAITPGTTGMADLPTLRRKLGTRAIPVCGVAPTTYATLSFDARRERIEARLGRIEGD